MIIKKLELQGFKSFPERTKIIYHPGITAIVGPNGTGKSNIVDAILWVLGGQRHKGLRGEKIEDIIFNGNAKKPAVGMADVSLTLEHQDEEILINHRVFRSGESEYRLNGKTARLKDIQDALWKRAVAEKEYFVIEQGSIGSLLTSKPAEKRQLVEEAAGTAFYKDRKKEAQSKLASSEQNLVRLEDIISEVARAKNSLQRQAQAAARYRKLREKARELAGLNFRRKLEQLEIRHEEAARQHGDCLVREKDLALQIKNEERELAERRREIWELETAIKDHQEALFGLESQLNRTGTDSERESKRIELLAEKMSRDADAAAELSRELVALEADIAARQKSFSELEAALGEKRAEIERATVANQAGEEGTVSRAQALEDLKSRQLTMLSERTELRNEIAGAEKELELLTRQEAKSGAQLDQEKTLLKSREQSLSEIAARLAEAHGIKAEKNRTVTELRLAIEDRQSAVSRTGRRLEEATRARAEEQYKLLALKKIEDSRIGTSDSTDVPEALGRLADLVDSDPEYAALVDALWKEEAEAAVIPAADFLKRAAEREIHGRFLLVPPLQEAGASRPEIQDADILGRLKSRLRPNSKIQDYFSRLRDAFIVRDVPAAVRLWLRFPEANFITQNGDLLLSSGLLRLGRGEEGVFALGQEIRKGEERLRRWDEEISPLALELETLNREKQKLEEDLSRETALAGEIDSRLYGYEKEKIAAEPEMERSRSAVVVLSQEVEILGEEKTSLLRSKEALDQKLLATEKEEKLLRDKIAAEEKELLTQQGKTVEDEKRFIGLRADAALIEERSNNLGRQVRELLERQNLAQTKISSLDEEIRQAAAEQAEARRAGDLLEARSRSLEEEKKLKQADLAQKQSALQAKHAEEQERDKKLAGLREELEKRKEDRIRWEIIKAEIDRDMVNLEETCWQELKKTLHEVKDERPEVEITDAEIEEQLAQTEEDLQKYKSVNLMAEEEYLSHKERYDFLIQQRNDLRESIDSTQAAILKIDEESKSQFMTALAEVNKYFQEVFTQLFKGGSAEVKLTDESQPLESGVEIIAQPPGKKVQNITLLSGGEKSLTSLAFLFALFRYKPTPFCILDEVDAALDDVNLARFLDLMKNIKSDTQFIIITHNYKTMEVADFIYGTTMAEPNITNLYSVKLEKQQELTQ
jgi:chromosome segregation protein